MWILCQLRKIFKIYLISRRQVSLQSKDKSSAIILYNNSAEDLFSSRVPQKLNRILVQYWCSPTREDRTAPRILDHIGSDKMRNRLVFLIWSAHWNWVEHYFEYKILMHYKNIVSAFDNHYKLESRTYVNNIFLLISRQIIQRDSSALNLTKCLAKHLNG